MSAWILGVNRPKAERLSGTDAAVEMIGRVVRWIPGDVLVLFASAINLVSPEPKPPSAPLLVAFLFLTPLVVILGAFAGKDTFAPFALVKALLATIAFAIWSLSIPRSGWQQLDLVSKNPGWVTACSAVGAVLFALLAQGIERRYDSGEYDKGGPH